MGWNNFFSSTPDCWLCCCNRSSPAALPRFCSVVTLLDSNQLASSSCWLVFSHLSLRFWLVCFVSMKAL